jgi:phosphoglycerate kinase
VANAFLSVRDLDVKGKRVFLRLDLNVPIKGGVIRDDSRIRASLPTIAHLLEGGAAVLACSHLGRPKGQVVPDLSLAPVAKRLQELLPEREVLFATDVAGPDATFKASQLEPGQLLLLENARFEPGETKDDLGLAQRLRALADLYVTDAFGAMHRAHASVSAAATLFPSAAMGFLLERELEYLSGKLENPERPYTAFLGGAKVADKIPVIKGLLAKLDVLCLGGAMAYTFLAAEAQPVGASPVESELVDACRETLGLARTRGVRCLLPVDHRAALSMEDPEVQIVSATRFPTELAGFDIGPSTTDLFCGEAAGSRTIFWNGPMGVFERPQYAEGTLALARAIAESGAISVVGGGDSISAVHKAGITDKISHISTGGGASLELLAGERLPGLAVLTRK